MTAFDVGLLEFGTVTEPGGAASVCTQVVRRAHMAERCGYTDLWLAEHHAVGSAWANPTVMATHILGQTTRIRVATAGILLSHYSPLAVANDFALLATLFPGRVELGVARGYAAAAAAALGHAKLPLPAAEFDPRVEELMAHLHDTLEVAHPSFGAVTTPFPPRCPPVWIMGTGSGGALLAARAGLRYCHSIFHGGTPSNTGIAQYRAAFEEGPLGATARAAVAIAGICMPTTARARAFEPRISAHSVGIRANVVGTPTECAESISRIAAETGAETVIFLDLTLEEADREYACESIAAALGLPGLPQRGRL